MTSLRFHEHMAGFLSFGQSDYRQAWLEGRRAGRRCTLDVEIEIDDVEHFVADPRHTARATGLVECAELGGRLVAPAGSYNLLVDSAHPRTVRMRYRLFGRDADARPFTFSGFKDIADDPTFDVWTDTTTLYARLLTSHVGEEQEAADPHRAAERTVASGILRVSFAGLLRLLASIRVQGGRAGRRAAAAERFGKLFAGELWRVYGGRLISEHVPDFPDPTDPGSERWHGQPPGQWHDTPELVGLRRRIVGFEAGDGLPLTLHNVRRRDADGGRTPVLLHGAGVRANVFFNAPGRRSIVHALVDRGFDVWLANWRASIDLPPTPYTLDQAALYDHPAAIRKVLDETGVARLRVLAHCQGSTSFVITALAGHAPQAERVVSTAVSLHPLVPRLTRIKCTTILPLLALGTPYVSAQWGAVPPSPLAHGVAWWASKVRRECDDPVCSLGNYMYGTGRDVLWRHQNLDADTHRWTNREFGYAPFRFLRQMARSVRHGHLVPVDGLRGLPPSYVAQPPRIDAPWILLAGNRSRLFVAESQLRTYAFLDRHQPGRHQVHLIDGYGHLDILLGRNAPRDTSQRSSPRSARPP